MPGSINGIWLTPKDGVLHPQIIPNLSSIGKEANSCHFSVVLWTNLSEIQESEVVALKEHGIIVKDYSECNTSIFYNYFLFFLQLGIKGDKAAFALASDILRMAILEVAPAEEFVIYADPNDIVFFNLETSLNELEQRFLANSFGFSFDARFIPAYQATFETRNDVLIALKQNNLSFFKSYFAYYQAHLMKKYHQYKKPQNNEIARELARDISNQTGAHFFDIFYIADTESRLYISAKFGDYVDYHDLINCAQYLPHARQGEHGGSWLQEEGPINSYYTCRRPSRVHQPYSLTNLCNLRFEIDEELTRVYQNCTQTFFQTDGVVEEEDLLLNATLT